MKKKNAPGAAPALNVKWGTYYIASAMASICRLRKKHTFTNIIMIAFAAIVCCNSSSVTIYL
jgi:hypothetical protein